MQKVDLSQFVHTHQSDASTLKLVLWNYTEALFFTNSLWPIVGLKSIILRAFGAKVGKNVMIKPNVQIKYPWKLEVGDNTWIGEHVWIDNLEKVRIGANCCISQGAMLLTGNHDFTSSKFDLIEKAIVIQDGAWIGAKSVVCPGLTVQSHSVLTVGSIATKDLEAYSIYQGNPAVVIKNRNILK